MCASHVFSGLLVRPSKVQQPANVCQPIVCCTPACTAPQRRRPIDGWPAQFCDPDVPDQLVSLQTEDVDGAAANVRGIAGTTRCAVLGGAAQLAPQRARHSAHVLCRAASHTFTTLPHCLRITSRPPQAAAEAQRATNTSQTAARMSSPVSSPASLHNAASAVLNRGLRLLQEQCCAGATGLGLNAGRR